MTTNEEIHAAVLAIHSRLGVIEGKVNLVARAERDILLSLLESIVRGKPLVGQIYLLLDGQSNQKEIFEKLDALGIETSLMSVSRAVGQMQTEYGIADLISEGGGKVYRRDPAMDKVLNLAAAVRRWLTEEGAITPDEPGRRRRRRRN